MYRVVVLDPARLVFLDRSDVLCPRRDKTGPGWGVEDRRIRRRRRLPHRHQGWVPFARFDCDFLQIHRTRDQIVTFPTATATVLHHPVLAVSPVDDLQILADFVRP